MAELQGRGDPPSNFQGSNTKRKCGGQPGNTNRLRHGGFGAPSRARREQVRALIAETNALIMRIGMVARMRDALKAVKSESNRTISPSPCGRGRMF